MGNYHWFPSYFVTWSCWLREIIIDFPQTLALIMLVMVNDHWFPSDFVTCSCWLWLIIIDFHQTLSLGYVGYGKLSLIFLRIVTWSCWLWEIIIDFPQTLSLGYSFPSDFVTWSSWVWLIIIDFPQTLSSGHVGYGKLSLISLRLCHVVMLVKGNYHWFPSDFATWSCWLRKIIIDFPQTLSLGYVGNGKLSLIFLRICHVVMLVMGNYHWFPSDFVKWSRWLREIIIDFPQTLSLGHVGYG
jgi:succinate dehydrogenase/fumarate reductase cytochrome b subunit